MRSRAIETPPVRVRRLVLALEELFEKQYFLLETGDLGEALGVQDRCRPLVTAIAETMMQPGVARALDIDTQQRAQRLMERQLEQIQKIEDRKKAVRDQLKQIAAAQTRATQFRSAYAEPAAPAVARIA
jgi:hypothetical protein